MMPSPPLALMLRAQAQRLAQAMPALLVHAPRLQSNLRPGVHGRRQAGQGEEFWQYRPAIAGDQMSRIDWRRSARSESVFIRETEWQSPQSVHFHIDQGGSMDFTSRKDGETKAQRAMLLGLAIASLLSRSGERFALLRDPTLARTGPAQLNDFTVKLATAAPEKRAEFDLPGIKTLRIGGQVVMLSDFLAPWAQLHDRLLRIASQQVDGVLLQILDPTELTFPYRGRVRFQSMRDSIRFEARNADALRQAYLKRLAERQDQLSAFARRFAWRYNKHNTKDKAQSALLWLCHAMSL